jgi:hypothetical protein
MLENSKPNLRVLHPLPRVNEIAYDVDDNPKAYYFQQAKNGLYARQAIICKVLGINPADFNDASVITLAKQLYISVEMTAYVEAERQKKLKGEEYDENAFDYKTGEPLTFRK